MSSAFTRKARIFCFAATLLCSTGAITVSHAQEPQVPVAAQTTTTTVTTETTATPTPVATTPTTTETAPAAQPTPPSLFPPITEQQPAAPAVQAETITVAPQLPTAAVNTTSPSAPPTLPGTPEMQQQGPPSLLPAGPNDDFDFSAAAQSFEPEKSEQQIQDEARREAYDAALQGLLPLRPAEIRELLEHFDKTQESVEVPVYPNPKPEVTVQTVSLDPGAQPVTVKVAHGHVTTLNILDITGAPWPIEDISWAGNFEVIESSASQGSHIIRISPSSEFAYGNMSIRLLTLKTPVIITLETSRETVHYRFDAIIPDYGPNAEAPLIDGGVSLVAGDRTISTVLEGVAPPESERLVVSGTDGRTSAYRLGGITYVRTPHTLLSPGWTSSVASADGMHVYAIADTPVIILSDSGHMVRARLSDREDLFDEQ